MRLPAELRVRVYELVLGFPKSGVTITQDRHDRRGARVRLATGDYNVAKSPWNWISRGGGYRLSSCFRSGRLQEHLALLQTSKQVYAEAMPVFYGMNSFVCLNDNQFLEQTSDERKKHIRDVTISVRTPGYNRPSLSQMTNCFKIIKGMSRLRTLDVVVFEHEWQQATTRNGKPKYRKYEDLLNLEPIKALRSMRGLQKVEFHGECESISKILVPEMTASLLGSTRKKRVTRKRAAKDGDDSQDGADAGKAKRGKMSKAS